MRRLVQLLPAAMTLAFVAAPQTVSADVPTVALAPTGQTFHLQADAVSASAFALTGVTTDAGVDVLVLTARSLSFTGYVETDPCFADAENGVSSTVVRTASGALSVTGTDTSPVTMHATQLTYNGLGVTWTPASHPDLSSGPVTLPDTVNGLVMDATVVTATTLTGAVREQAKIC